MNLRQINYFRACRELHVFKLARLLLLLRDEVEFRVETSSLERALMDEDPLPMSFLPSLIIDIDMVQ